MIFCAVGGGGGRGISVPTFVGVGGWVGGWFFTCRTKPQYLCFLPIKLKYFKRWYPKLQWVGCGWVCVGSPRIVPPPVHLPPPAQKFTILWLTTVFVFVFENALSYTAVGHIKAPCARDQDADLSPALAQRVTIKKKPQR
jgi:hypothetical protein